MFLACAEQPGSYTEETGQVQVLGEFAMNQSGEAGRDWRLEGDGGVFHEQDSTLLMWGVRLVTYENDSPASMLTADSGEVVDNGNFLRAWGSARVETSEGRVLTSPELTWNDSLAVFMTDCLAVLEIPESLGTTLITGRGVALDRSLGSAAGVDVRQSFTAVYSGEVGVEE